MFGRDVQQTCTSCATFLLVVIGVTTSAYPASAQSAATSLAATQTHLASAQLSADRLSIYSDLVVEWLQEYLQIDTTNPPGNELRAANFFKKILDREGIENRVYEYQPGRADLWARIPHTTAEAKRPIILLNHMDVVSSDAAHWKVPPFSGQMLDGSIYGRGGAGHEKRRRGPVSGDGYGKA